MLLLRSGRSLSPANAVRGAAQGWSMLPTMDSKFFLCGRVLRATDLQSIGLRFDAPVAASIHARALFCKNSGNCRL